MIKVDFQLIVDYCQTYCDKTLQKFPEEKKNIKGILKFEISCNLTYLVIYYYFQQKNQLLQSFKRPEKERIQFKKACYYNSISYMKKYSEKYPELKSAWGISADEYELNHALETINNYINGGKSSVGRQIGIRHAFNIYKGKIIDPTLPGNHDIMAYEIVGENIYKQFNWLNNDQTYNAKHFSKYCDSRQNAIVNYMIKKVFQKVKF